MLVGHLARCVSNNSSSNYSYSNCIGTIAKLWQHQQHHSITTNAHAMAQHMRFPFWRMYKLAYLQRVLRSHTHDSPIKSTAHKNDGRMNERTRKKKQLSPALSKKHLCLSCSQAPFAHNFVSSKHYENDGTATKLHAVFAATKLFARRKKTKCC